MTDKKNLQPVFVYGTLRIGQGNHSWASDGIVKEVAGAKCVGALYHVTERRVFPVAKLDEPGVITGDVLWFDIDSWEFREVISMETGAGYRIQQVSVELPDGSDLMTWAFHYDRRPDGQRIESGDWLAPDAYMNEDPWFVPQEIRDQS